MGGRKAGAEGVEACTRGHSTGGQEFAGEAASPTDPTREGRLAVEDRMVPADKHA